ncbi:MAG: hypothetical protein ACRDL7_16105, partial [Gaiellaceae bacterium]
MIENIPYELQSNRSLREYFHRMFPNKVREVAVCLDTDKLVDLIDERQEAIEKYENAEAKMLASKSNDRPMIRNEVEESSGLVSCWHRLSCCGGCGDKVDALNYYQGKITRLNNEIDSHRAALCQFADKCERPEFASCGSIGLSIDGVVKHIFPISAGAQGKVRSVESAGEFLRIINKEKDTGDGEKANKSSGMMKYKRNIYDASEDGELHKGTHDGEMMTVSSEDKGDIERANRERTTRTCIEKQDQARSGVHVLANADVGKLQTTSSAFLTFTSLRAKQCAVQCEISGIVDCLDVTAAPEPNGVIWSNGAVSGRTRRIVTLEAAI